MLDQVQHFFIAHAALVRPLGIAKDFDKSVIGFFNPPQGFLQSRADVGCFLSDIFPVATFWNLKTVILSKFGIIEIIAAFFQRLLIFFIPYIADALEKQ
ncbi:MAG: hypothetical protein HDKAJFGB_01016 [Anaerolineae bacterium]|nr:hypothetical protein [Anaerolineae bacterium]